MKTFTIGKKKIVLKEEWMVGFITTWIVGLLAHAYRFFNFLPIWDSIYNFTGVGSTYTLGRWFLGYAGLITSMFDLPWVNGREGHKNCRTKHDHSLIFYFKHFSE